MFSDPSAMLNRMKRETVYRILVIFRISHTKCTSKPVAERAGGHAIPWSKPMTDQEQEAYELFRRAILYRDDDAWATIHTRYRSMLVTWALRAGLRPSSPEGPDDIANHALARAWLALTPERFAQFSSLAKLLCYLRTCVVSTVIDSLRAQASLERITRRSTASIPQTPEHAILAGIDREMLWRMVLALSSSRAERVVLVESFTYGRPPRDIQALYPELFPDVMAVYSVKRNLFARLQRNRDLVRLCSDFVAM
jgi:DNA-directed RNA polymerase specialized sigma24 family protein